MTDAESLEQLNRLRKLLFCFDEEAHQEMKLIVSRLLTSNLKAKTFQQFHQILLCMMAYPVNKELLTYTKQAIEQLLHTITLEERLQQKLIGTGLLHTTIECNFSFNKVKFLLQTFSGKISIHSAASTLETQKSTLKIILPKTEYAWIHAGELPFKERLSTLIAANQTDLEWLVQTIEQTGLTPQIQEFLYQQLEVFVHWKITEVEDTVSFLRGTSLPVYYHTSALEKKYDAQNIIEQRLPKPIALSKKEKLQILHAAKLTLVYLYRETEPFTHANHEDVTVYSLCNGLSVALIGSHVNKRYSLESYIGYLVLKNNMPVSYGGGWIFGEHCQFGINILEAFRGGESTLIICQLLRTYHQHFGVTQFIVKPYQFGWRNAEAIRTGAFWFYYKLGFRPENKQLKELAEKEDNRKKTEPGFKSSPATLRKFTKSNLVLSLSNSSYPSFDPEELSKRITSYIQDKFKGNRQQAINTCFNQFMKNTGLDTKFWRDDEINYSKQVALLFCLEDPSGEWQGKHSKDIEKFVRLKSAKTELTWVRHLQKFKPFWELVQRN